jgi:DNA topoisomerase-3
MQKMGTIYLKMSSDRVMSVAESLYQKGFLSYPRTETDQFNSDFNFNELIQAQTGDPSWGSYAQSLLNGKFKTPRKGKNNDQAHPPIHPTKAQNDSFTQEEKKIYELVVRRFLACCSDDAKGFLSKIAVSMGREKFHASGDYN